MGVANSQKYTISKHAAMRIQTRFNIPQAKVHAWTNRFLTDAVFFQDCNAQQNDDLQIYKKDEVLMILNVKEFVVVTAYAYNPFNKSDGVSEAVLKLLQPSVKRLVKKQKVKLRDELDGLMMDLQIDYQSFQNHPESDELLQKYVSSIQKINTQIADSQALMKDFDVLKK